MDSPDPTFTFLTDGDEITASQEPPDNHSSVVNSDAATNQNAMADQSTATDQTVLIDWDSILMQDAAAIDAFFAAA